MVELTEVNHNIQKNILSILMHQRYARFRDMRPPRTDTNLYSYHLTKLIKNGLVKKTDEGYTLCAPGMVYVDRLSVGKMFLRPQPKIITMLVIQNSNGDILLQRRKKQPYIDTWSLPYGKLHNDDLTLLDAAKREASEKVQVINQDMKHAGDCYIRVHQDGQLLTVTLAHIFAFNRDDIQTNDDTQWMRPHKLGSLDLAPCVQDIMTRTFFRDPFFFEEFEEAW